MLILKCVGTGAIIAGAFTAARIYRKGLADKETVLGAVEQGLRFLEGRIALSEKMLCDVCRECGTKFFEGKESNLFSIFAKKLSSGSDAGRAWRESVTELKKGGCGTGLGDEEAECLLRLETAFTLSDVSRYSDSFNHAADEIKQMREQAECKRKKDGDTAMKLSLCGALAAVLLLW